MKKINILCAAIICGFAISACNGGEKPQAASEAETSTTDLNKLEQGLTWDNLRQVLNKTPVEAGLYSGKGELGKAVVQALKGAGVNPKLYPESFIVREDNGIFYTGGYNPSAELGSDVFYLLLRPLSKGVSVCRVNVEDKTLCHDYAGGGDKEIPGDVILLIDNLIQSRHAQRNGERIMNEQGIDPMKLSPEEEKAFDSAEAKRDAEAAVRAEKKKKP